MQIVLWVIIGVLIVITAVLFVKIYLLRKSAREIEEAFADRLITDTNTLIDISSSDRYMRNLANAINIQLRNLRMQRHRFQQGDIELKNAITNISHDLRTPLTAICGYVDLLEREEQSETACRYINIIKNRADLITKLTEELFRYSIIISEKSNLATEPVVINGVLEESVAAFYTALKERSIVPKIKLSENKIIRTVDRSALMRVFSNLLNNAVKYSDGDIEITLSDTGEIVFSNTAFALNEVQVGKLFDRFYTVETAGKSTGLGLAIARTLIEQMNGKISATYKNNRLSIYISFSGA